MLLQQCRHISSVNMVNVQSRLASLPASQLSQHVEGLPLRVFFFPMVPALKKVKLFSEMLEFLELADQSIFVVVDRGFRNLKHLLCITYTIVTEAAFTGRFKVSCHTLPTC